MKKWLPKGEYEKTAIYIERVNTYNRNQQLKKYENEIISKLKAEAIEEIDPSGFSIGYFDADNETFPIKYEEAVFVLAVPINVAQQFKESFSDMKFHNFKMVLTEGAFKLSHFEVVAPNGQQYIWDHTQQNPYQTTEIKYDFEAFEVNLPDEALTKTTPTIRHITIENTDIDSQLPSSNNRASNAIAVVIGNKKYQKTKNVDFALNDAAVIKKYLIDVLGYKKGNILYYENASLSDFRTIFGNKNAPIGKLYNTIRPNRSDVFIYYAGHGAPSLDNQQSYFLPIDCDPQYISKGGYSLDVFYENLAQLPAKSITVVLDACFSGADIFENISSVGIKPTKHQLNNGVIFTSSTGNQVSCWYNEQGHGLFTYFFLKAIHNKNGDTNRDNCLTLQEIYDYISDNANGVPYFSRRLHGVNQQPQLFGKDTSRVFVKF